NLQGRFGCTMERFKLVCKISYNLAIIKIKKVMYRRLARHRLQHFQESFRVFHSICTGQGSEDTSAFYVHVI
ncbi:PIPO, partial [Pepper veinal mottle virus]